VSSSLLAVVSSGDLLLRYRRQLHARHEWLRSGRTADDRDELAAALYDAKRAKREMTGSVHETASVATGSPQALWIVIRE